MYIFLYTCTHVCSQHVRFDRRDACIYIYIYIYIRIYIYTYILHTHVYVFTYTHIYIYTHLHIYMGIYSTLDSTDVMHSIEFASDGRFVATVAGRTCQKFVCYKT